METFEEIFKPYTKVEVEELKKLYPTITFLGHVICSTQVMTINLTFKYEENKDESITT